MGGVDGGDGRDSEGGRMCGRMRDGRWPAAVAAVRHTEKHLDSNHLRVWQGRRVGIFEGVSWSVQGARCERWPGTREAASNKCK